MVLATAMPYSMTRAAFTDDTANAINGWETSSWVPPHDPAWWDEGYLDRTQLTVTTGATAPMNGYDGYSVRAEVDTGTLVGAGALQANCNDLRVLRWDGALWTELDRHLIDCGAAATKVWFKLQADIANSASDSSYWLYHGNPAAGPGPADRNQVYLKWDDFENHPLDATPTGWTVQSGGPWHVVNDGQSNILRRKSSGGTTGVQLIKADGISEHDVYVQVRLRLPGGTGTQASGPATRMTGTSDADGTLYLATLRTESGVKRQRLTLYSSLGETSLNGSSFEWVNDTWYTVGLASFGSTHQQWRDGTPVLSATDSSHSVLGAVGLASGTVNTNYDYDEFLARRYIDTEPSVTVGTGEGLSLPPSTPVGLIAGSGSDAEVPLAWGPVAGASSYTVWHREQGTVTWTTASGITTNDHTVAGLVNDVTYEFRVRAVNDHGTSDWSAVVTATPQALAPPTLTGQTILLSANANLAEGQHPGRIGPALSYRVYANVYDDGSLDAVAADVSAITPGEDTVALTYDATGWTVGATTYHWRSELIAADASLLDGATPGYTVTATDGVGGTGDRSDSAVVDHGALLQPATAFTVDGGCIPGTISFVGSSGNAVDALTLTIARPPGVQAGDVMVAGVGGRGTGALPAPSGSWTELLTDSIGDFRQTVWYRVAGESEPADYTWSMPATRRVAGGITAYRGVSNSTPIDAVASQAAISATITAPSITTTVADTMLVGIFGVQDSTALTGPASMAMRWNHATTSEGSAGHQVRSYGADEARPQAGTTGIRTATGGSSGNAGVLIALRPREHPRVSATWSESPSAFATGYWLHRYVGGAHEVTGTITPRTTVSHLDDAVVSGTAYEYGLQTYASGTVTWETPELMATTAVPACLS
jgi:hypothetical protein